MSSPSFGWKFRAYVDFMYDPGRQRYEDLIFDFHVQPVMPSWPEGLNGSPLCPDAPDRPDAGQPDAAVFEIGRGPGERLAALEPVVLPGEDASPEYARAVVDYAARSIALIDQQMPTILDALSVQYLEPAEDRWLIEEYQKEGRPLPPGWFGERPPDR
jgi:hypothetical protein